MDLARSDLELEVLYNRIKRGELDLQPDFQRGEVWDRARQARLVDTILRSWYIPAIHIVRDKNEQPDYVLDGQQRLRTVSGFFDDEIKVAGRLDPIRDELIPLDGLRYSQLPIEWQRTCRRFPITVITLTKFEPAEPSELFFRLNQQYSLTPPEKRNALFGPARDQVKDIVNHLTQVGAFSPSKIGFGNGRLAYDDIIARFCVVLQEQTLHRHISNIYIEQFYRREKFRRDVIDQATSTAEILGGALDHRRVKFNKATLFSWLVFVHSIGSEELPLFLGEFESARTNTFRFDVPPMQALIKAYNDRASYRVLDVNSVLIRDLVLHCSHAFFGWPDQVGSELPSILDRIDRDDNAERVLLEFIQSSDWGAVL